MAELNIRKLRSKALGLSKVRSVAFSRAQLIFENERGDFLESFSQHEITKEIDAGENSLNTSGTLGGYGNLFSFIGFNKGSNPTRVIKDMISKIRILKKPIENKFYLSFSVIVPKKEDFERACSMPWATGRSWLSGIERGISGFGFFLSKKDGRSEGGVQAENSLRGGTFNRTSYFSKMYNTFISGLLRGGLKK